MTNDKRNELDQLITESFKTMSIDEIKISVDKFFDIAFMDHGRSNAATKQAFNIRATI